jgi:hypothetical protein
MAWLLLQGAQQAQCKDAVVSRKNMKAILNSLLGAGMILAATSSVQAIPISGSLQFVGSATMNAAGTAFVGFSDPIGGGLGPWVLGGTQTGSYSGVTDSTTAIWSPFTFNPPAASVTPLWTFTIGTTIYSFDATSMTGGFVNNTTLNISGAGIAHITGFDDTLGIWTVTATGSGLNFTFGASTDAGSVADGGTTLLLLGVSLTALALVSKRLAYI